MKIYQDGLVATATTPSRKAVSFGNLETGRHSGKTPLRERNYNKSPHPSGEKTPGSKADLFKSPANQKAVTSNSFRQGLKKGFTPSSAKTKMGEGDKENNNRFTPFFSSMEEVEESQQQKQQQKRQLQLKAPPKTPSSASALRRTLRSTVQQPTEQQQQQPLKNTNNISQPKRISLRTSSNIGSGNHQPFQSLTTAMTYSSSYATSSLAGRSRLLGKGGLAPGKSSLSALGPPARVAPKTPNTLLRTELDDEDDFEESMLLSPPPGALWDALNLSSGGGGDKRHTMSPTVTTGLIVISPQAAEQIHTWSSTKKRLSASPDLPPADDDKLSPAMPRALMQTPHAAPATTDPSPTNDAITSSPTEPEREISSDMPTVEENEQEGKSSHAMDSPTLSSVEDVESSEVNNETLSQSVQKSTKGGIAMDLTDLFSPENSKVEKTDHQQDKKWAESTPLSSSMPPALLARLNSKRQTQSKLPPATSKLQPRKQEASSLKSKATTTRPSTATRTSTTNKDSITQSTARTTITKNQPKDVTNRKAARDNKDKPWKRKTLKNTSTAKENKPSSSIQKVKETTNPVKPWKKQASKKLPAPENETTEVQKKSDLGMVKPWQRKDKKVTTNPREVEKNKSLLSTETSSVQEDASVMSKATHRGGLAFDVDLDENVTSKTSLPPSRNRRRTIMKSSTTVVAREPAPSGSWADRQCEVFVGWLNYTLSPEEMDVNNEGCIASGLRALIVHRRLAEGRVNALKLYKGDSMHQIRSTIVREIARGRLSIRADRDVAVDVHLRTKLTSLLLSYTTPWLRMALEVMFGECIEPVPFSESSPRSYVGRMKLALEFFIKKRFLSDDGTLQKFTRGRCNVPSGRFETRYKEEIRNLVLSRIITLVFLLDRAKEANALENVPRLFTVSSDVKSTRDVLVTICRECLSAEGDIIKHFSRIGLKVSYVQDPVDEVNFKVKNLATDLRDGVILTRLAEIVTGASFKSRMRSLRLPVVSRLQKKFNVNLAVSAIKDFGITVAEGINAHHVMDGHKEMVLALMWCIIAHSCMEKLLQGDQVEQEILNVIQSSQAREKVQGRVYKKLKYSGLSPTSASPVGRDPSPDKILKDLLLRWSHAVCSSFGMPINDLSNSFASGKALSLLVHYYHPSLIRVEEIFPASSESALNLSQEEIMEKERKNWRRASISMQQLGGIPDMLPICDSQNPPNEQSMLLCLSYLCSRLMESSREIFATILIQACYRNYSRKVLMEKKTAAASTIFRIWTENRENYFRKQKQQYKIAVATLEDFVISHKHALKRLRSVRLEKELMARSAIDIQRLFRGFLGRIHADEVWEEHLAANAIQKTFRGYLARQAFADLSVKIDSAIMIQSAFRRFVAFETFLDYRFHVIELQRTYRGYLARKEMKAREYSALVIQQAWWSYLADVESEMAATLIQKRWRGALGRRSFMVQSTRRDAACSIQKVWRSYYQSLIFYITRESAIAVQRVARGYIIRRATPVNTYRNAAISIQKMWRGFSRQVQFQMTLFDVVCIQSLARRFLSQRAYLNRVQAVSTLQCAMRCSIARHQVVLKIEDRDDKILRHRSAVIIQAYARGYLVQRDTELRHYCAFVIQNRWRKLLSHRLSTTSSTIIQSSYRAWKCRQMLTQSKIAAVNIQRCWRGFVSRQNDIISSFAATQIQAAWRRYWAYSDYTMYLKESKSATLIQARIRGMVTRTLIETHHSLAFIIQTQWQKYKQHKLHTCAVIKIQAAFRSNQCRSNYLEKKQATLTLQKVARAFQARKIFHLKRNERQCEEAATLIQKMWRGFSKQVQFQVDVFDIICVQSICRKYLACTAYQRSRVAAATIQRGFRCYGARQERSMRELVLNTLVMESSTRIQTIVRGHVSRSIFLAKKKASINIQRFWRGSRVREHIHELSCHSRTIQSAWRMYKLHANYNVVLDATTKIQTSFRLFSKRNKFLAMREAAICIQRCRRGETARRHLMDQSHAATKIQAHWRRSVAQNNYLLDLLEIKSATVIQASFRMYVRRLDYMVVKYSAHTIQRYTRGLLSRVDLAVKHFAASEIQRVWRGYCTYSSKTIISSLIKIQSVIRMAAAKKKVEEIRILYWVEVCNRNRNATVIQNSFREYKDRRRRNKASVVVQRAYRFYSELKRIQSASRGMIKFQARVRGAWVRGNRSKRVAELAYRIEEETRRAILDPTLRLGYRTSQALEILQTSQSLTKIMDAVKELEASTRLSVVCCQVFTKVNAANILLHLIQSCNRSVPHMELKEHILLTLENVAQYPSLVGSFAHYKYAEVFLDNVQVFRDKDGIFCLAVVLLDRIAKADQEVAYFCATHEHLKRLKEVYRVVSNKRIVKHKKALSDKVKRLRKYGLAKRDDFDRAVTTRMLGEMIDAFSEIEVLRVATPTSAKCFNFE